MTAFLILDLIDEMLLWMNTWSEMNTSSNKSEYWEVIKTEKKGYAMFAKRDIPAYTLISIEKPILCEWRNRSAKQSLLDDFNELPSEKQNIVMSLANVFDDEEKASVIDAIYDTNGCQTNASTIHSSGLFPNFARLNHSCLPNCTMYFKSFPAESLIVKTLFPITEGTELTVSYLPRLKNTYRERQRLLSERYRFECDCCLCSDGEKWDEIIHEYNLCLMNSDKHLNCAQTALGILNTHFKSFPTIKANVLSSVIDVALESYMYDKAYDAIVESIKLNMKCYGLSCKRWKELHRQITLLKSYSNDKRCDMLLKKYTFLERHSEN